jgi:hypothetical protein
MKYTVRLEEGCYDSKYNNLVFETNNRPKAIKMVKNNNRLYATTQSVVIAYWSSFPNGIVRDGRNSGNLSGTLVINGD